MFRGRIAEDFKLMSGTFVSVGTLRLALLSASHGLLTDAVVCGQDGEFVTAMVWLHPEQAGRVDAEGVPELSLREERLLVLREPAQLDTGEITDKGYVNQVAVRDRRSDQIRLLTANPLPRQVVVRS